MHFRQLPGDTDFGFLDPSRTQQIDFLGGQELGRRTETHAAIITNQFLFLKLTLMVRK